MSLHSGSRDIACMGDFCFSLWTMLIVICHLLLALVDRLALFLSVGGDCPRELIPGLPDEMVRRFI